MADEHDDDPVRNDEGEEVPEPDGPIRPEVVGRRPRSNRTAARTVTIACALLAISGVLGLVLGFMQATGPDDARCSYARTVVDDVRADDDDENDVGLDDLPEGVDVPADVEDEDAAIDDLSCDDVVLLANEIPDGRDVAPTSTFRTQGVLITVFGLVQAAGGLLTMRFRTKRARTIALVGGLLTILLPIASVVIGPLALFVPVFIIYGLYFSRDARSTFGDPGGLLGRRRQPPVDPAS